MNFNEFNLIYSEFIRIYSEFIRILRHAMHSLVVVRVPSISVRRFGPLCLHCAECPKIQAECIFGNTKAWYAQKLCVPTVRVCYKFEVHFFGTCRIAAPTGLRTIL
jgi:hypothetical protein